MKKEVFTIIVVVLAIVLTVHIYFTFLYVYSGKIIDADTKVPIEGAVVVASWREERPTPAGPTSRFHDVKETLTDKNGEWSIRGARGEKLGPSTLLSYVTSLFTGFMWGTYATQKPEFIVFKPGYCSWPAGFAIDACKEKIKTYDLHSSNNIGGIVELPRLTVRTRETLLLNIPFIASYDKEKLPIYERLLNLDEKMSR